LLVNRLLDQTEEFRKIILSGEAFPSSNFLNIYPYLNKSKVTGTFLDEGEFHEIRLSLITLKGCVDFFLKNQEQYPEFFKLLKMVNLDHTLLKAIERVLDEKGKIKNRSEEHTSELQSRENLVC